MGGTGRTIEQSVAVAAPPARVFAALTRPEEMARWLAREAAWDDEAAGRLSLDFGHARFEVVFLERVPDRRVSLRWCAGPGAGDRVAFDLEPREGGTLLRLVHGGFSADPEFADLFAGHAEGWAFYLCNLRCVLERGFDLREGQPPGTIAG